MKTVTIKQNIKKVAPLLFAFYVFCEALAMTGMFLQGIIMTLAIATTSYVGNKYIPPRNVKIIAVTIIICGAVTIFIMRHVFGKYLMY